MDTIKRLKPMTLPVQTSRANTIYVDSDTEEVKVGTGASGTSERVLASLGGSASFTMLAVGNGTVSDPSLQIGTEGNGFYRPSSTSISLSIGDTEDFRFDSTGILSLKRDTASLYFGASQDILLSRGAANRLDLATGDSFYVVGGGLGVGVTPPGSGAITSVDDITTGAAASFIHSGRTRFRSPATAQFVLENLAQDAGAGIDVATDGIFKIRNRAHNAYATVDALAFRVSGTQVVSSQGAAVADAAGGATIDAEARTALNALLARLRTHGLIAT